MTTKTLTTPTVHLNGTSVTDLLDGYRAAVEALDAALHALQVTAPHGRDYYVQPSTKDGRPALVAAQDEHLARVARLEDVRDELLALWVAVDAQEQERTARRRF